MREIVPPTGHLIDAIDAYADLDEPCLRLGLVTSLDGSATDERGWTSQLGGSADVRVLLALRAWADAILVGAKTIRTGRVGPHRGTAELRSWRLAHRRPVTAPIVVVSQTPATLDLRHRLFTQPETPTILLTTEHGASTVELSPTVRLLVVGDRDIDLREALAALRGEVGAQRLLCEGGPRLATNLLRADLVDELCLSIAPALVGQQHHTHLIDHLDAPINLRLHRAYEDDGVLFCRYRLT